MKMESLSYKGKESEIKNYNKKVPVHSCKAEKGMYYLLLSKEWKKRRTQIGTTATVTEVANGN